MFLRRLKLAHYDVNYVLTPAPYQMPDGNVLKIGVHWTVFFVENFERGN